MKGKTLFNAAKIVDRAGDEIDSMVDKLFELVKKELESEDFMSKVEEDEENLDESPGWVYKGSVNNYALYKKNAKTKATGYLGVQIILFDEEEKKITDEEPLVYILYSSGGKWEYDEFRLYKAIGEGWELNKCGCIWERFDDDEKKDSQRPWDESEWVFILPLVSINNAKDLSDFLVTPIKSLLKSKSPEVVFSNNNRVLHFFIDGSEIKLKEN